MQSILTPEIILQAYRQGIFPMAEDRLCADYDFYRPQQRGQLSIPHLHIPKKLYKEVKRKPFTLTINTAFKEVINACAEAREERPATWINEPIRNVFIELHELGYAHSIEVWEHSNLVGGLYGLAIGSVFCGESMFSRSHNASKIALVHLCARLYKGGFTVLDTQFTNSHLEQFGVYEILQEEYESLIQVEMNNKADFLLNGINEDILLQDYLTSR